MSGSKPSFDAAPFEPDEAKHRRKLAEFAERANRGKVNVTLDVTLAANAASTTVKDARIGYYSAITPAMALTANGAAAMAAGTLYIPQATIITGQCVIQHANNAQTDRTIRFVILG